MRILRATPVALVCALLFACALPDLTLGQGSSSSKGDGGLGGDGGDAAPAITGQGCGTEIETGVPLCLATSTCPSVVVDTEAFPTCGFRIRGGVADLVCACGTQICTMGAYATCAQAAALLTSQTYQSVCSQVAEGRCVESAAPPSSSSGGGTGCDRRCLAECGGGAGCAALCNCT